MNIFPITEKEIDRVKIFFFPFFQNEPLSKEGFFSSFSEKTKKALTDFLKKECSGEEGEIKSLWLPEGNIAKAVFFGLGERKKWNARKVPLYPRQLVRYAKKEKIKEFTTPLLALGENVEKSARLFAINAVMAHFEYNKYKTTPKEGWPEIKNIYLACKKPASREVAAGVREGTVIGEETNLCRELANTPGGDMTPKELAKAAVQSARKNRFRVKILEEKAIKKLGMGGVLGVARGSDEKPKFIVLEYRGGPVSQKPLVLVGKGVTFDTGGLNLKPGNSIYEMHMDMSGGAAVIHGISAIARLKLLVNVIGLVPAVENMPSGSSYRPGDLLKTMSGKTIEVLNTDAEGRVILADALYYGSRMKPGLMVDFATLTGAAHVALGSYASALFTKEESLQTKLSEIGTRSGDYVWPLPLWDEYLPEIKGTFGDLTNIGKPREGDAIHGAKFLEQFTDGARWAHIDIAPKMTTLESEYLAKGASGVGVRYIVELAKEYPTLLKALNK